MRASFVSLLAGLALAGALSVAHADTEQPIQGGNTEPGYFSESCGDGWYLVGLQIEKGDFIDRVAPLCAELDRATGKLKLPATAKGAHGGGGGGAPEKFQCDSDHMLVGYFDMVMTRETQPHVDNLRIHCYQTTNLAQDMFSIDILSNDAGFNDNQVDALFVHCNNGDAPSGIVGKATNVVNGIAMRCSPVPATVMASSPAPTPAPVSSIPAEATMPPPLPAKSSIDRLSFYLNAVQGAGATFTDINSINWASAARVSDALCRYNGYSAGFFNGQQDLGGAYTYGITCLAGPGVFVNNYLDMHPFSDIDLSSWDVASSAATESCMTGALLGAALFSGQSMPTGIWGYLTGTFSPRSARDFAVVCVDDKAARAFQVTNAEILATGLKSTALNNTIWAAVARIADGYCRKKGAEYVSGFFDGVEDKTAGTHEVVCVGKPPSIFAAPGDIRNDTAAAAAGNDGSGGRPKKAVRKTASAKRDIDLHDAPGSDTIIARLPNRGKLVQDKIAKVINPVDPALNNGIGSVLDKVGNASNLAAIANSGANIKPGSLLSTANKIAILNAGNAPGLANAGAAAAGSSTIRSNNIQIGDNSIDGPTDTSQQAIVAGIELSPDEQKAHGLVSVNGGCSGTLINQYWVLTADHCITTTGAMYTNSVGGKVCQTVDLPAHLVITATWSPSVIRPTKTIGFCDSNNLDVGLIFLGAGDFGPMPIAPLFVGDMDNGTKVRKFGQGISSFAAPAGGGLPPLPAGFTGYHWADFTVAHVSHVAYDTPANPPVVGSIVPAQVGNGGDSGSSDWVLAPDNKTFLGIAGVQSTCHSTGYVVDDTDARTDNDTTAPRTWNWATGIDTCGSASIASIRDVIITATQEKAAPLPALAKTGRNRAGNDYFSKFLATPDPNLCAQACNADNTCRAWTYVLPGIQGLQANCFLKNPAPGETVDSCCISGTRAPLVVVGSPNNLPTTRAGATAIPTSPAPGAGVTFQGQWLTWLQNAHMYTLYLAQDATGRVTGSYEAGKITDGVVVGNQLFARWQQQSGSGTLMLVAAPDGTTFGGIWANGDVEPTPKNSGGTWDGYRTDVYAGVTAPNFGGEWAVTQSDGKIYPMKLTQSPAGVTGSFDLGNRQGSVRGHVGIETFILNHLAFTWRQEGNNLNGEGRFYMTPDSNRFSGVWHMAGNVTGAWSATRTAAAVAQETSSGKGAGTGTTKAPKGPTKPLPTPHNLPTQVTETIPPCVVPAPQAMDPANPWNGPWNSITGRGSKYSVVFNQSGGTVTGCFTPSQGVITDGAANGTTLTFHWVQDASAGGRYAGTAVFRLSLRNKNSFTGNWTADLAANGSGEWNGTRMAGATPVPDVNANAGTGTGTGTGNVGGGNASGLGKLRKLGKLGAASFAGDWDAVSGRNNRYAWHLDQNGTQVTGSYQPLAATISGNVSGQTLTFHWVEHQNGAVSGQGDGKVTLSGDSFSGHWWTAAAPDQNSPVNTWHATRTGGATIDVGGGGGGAPASTLH